MRLHREFPSGSAGRRGAGSSPPAARRRSSFPPAGSRGTRRDGAGARSWVMRRPPRALPRLLLRRADDEPLAALRTAALEDVAAGLGRVALAEPMLAVAADLARLVRALHDDWPPESEKRGKKARALRQVKEPRQGPPIV